MTRPHDRVDPASREVPAHREGAPLRMHDFDEGGVFRDDAASVDAAAWRWWREAPGFSQRFTGTFSADGRTIEGRSQLCEDGVHWNDDLQITYRRRA